MESKYFDSSPLVAPTKRRMPEELTQSPTAKRAKRAKRGRKRRSKDARKSGSYAEQEDWVYFYTSPATGSPIPRKQSPIEPPAPFPLKLAYKMHTMKSGEEALRTSEEDNEKDGAMSKKDFNETAKNDLFGQDNPKAEANTRKTRAEPDHKRKLKYPTISAYERIPAIAGPSKPRAERKELTEQSACELTPLSDLAPPVDYTFKAFPNPTTTHFTSTKASEESETKNKEATADGETPNGTTKKNDPDDETSLIIPACTAQTGTKKDLKFIKTHLKAIEAKLNDHSPEEVISEIQSLRTDITQLQDRLDRDGLRAAIRHEMLFNALIKVATDVGKLSSQIEAAAAAAAQDQHDEFRDEHGDDASTAGTPMSKVNQKKRDGIVAGGAAIRDSKDKQKVGLRQSRKTLEQCLRIYAEDMDRAGNLEDVKRYGGLCVQYAEDLFKTLG
ncbi:hypothetical protein C8A03DRAFT_12520 [Achaetomium macrosporum]|uniref:Uncharacterized protein n=1 Tax=Achaetomium macrosporum TaxID=79813 RepID=A0AAN7CFP5_9PEZI|nr:hypothetical protein C8A03DRAFT_12520 [Achaetomium macrosporum]